jgi:hypothetical protein
LSDDAVNRLYADGVVRRAAPFAEPRVAAVDA